MFSFNGKPKATASANNSVAVGLPVGIAQHVVAEILILIVLLILILTAVPKLLASFATWFVSRDA